jgi:hypothetical protein
MLSLTLSSGESLENRFSAHRIDGEGPFSWLHKGLLFLYPHDRTVDYLYCGKDNNLVVIAGLPKFSKMLDEELDEAHPAEEFLKTLFPWVAECMFAHSGFKSNVIDKSYIHMRSNIPEGFWELLHTPKTDIEHSLEVLKKYTDPRMDITSGRWQSRFYVLLGDGSVERWDLDGAVRPFSVYHLTRTAVEKPGTITPLPPAPGGGL